MQITITSVDNAPPELREQLPLVIELLRELPGDDRPDYWLGRSLKPIKWIDDNVETAVNHVVLATTRQGTAIVPGIENLPIGIAYVTDDAQLAGERFDLRNSKYVAMGSANETSRGAITRKPESDLRGVGGWLALLIVGLCIIGPLSGVGKLSGEFQSAESATPALASMGSWQTYQHHMWGVFGLSAALSFSAGYELWKVHSQKSVRFAILVLWLSNLAAVAGYSLVAYFAFGLSALNDSAPIVVKQVVSAIVVAGVWTLYLIKSRRVRNTYYSAPDKKH